MAHVGPADMRHAIGFALHYPQRRHLPVERLDLAAIGQFEFRTPDERRWPALRLARETIAAGGMTGTVFNAAKETALDGFIAGRVGFTTMADVVAQTLEDKTASDGLIGATMTLDNVLRVDHLARKAAKAAIDKRAG
jgi:1-deoxy-D-xylulose-5-phosphate reductoisomerase